MISGASEEELELANVIADKLLLQKENQQLKQINEEHKKLNGELMVENQELKKQQKPDYYTKGLEGTLIEYQQEMNKVVTQQKEFIKYLENQLKLYKEDMNKINAIENPYKWDEWKDIVHEYEVILRKYKKIIGVSDENN